MFEHLRAALGDSLAPLNAFRQFVVFRLSQNDDGTLDKIPVNPYSLHNASPLDPANWLDAREALGVAEQHNLRIGWQGYGVGFVLTRQAGLWCLDIDNCFGADGQLSTLAQEAYQYFAGAAVERSISGRGLHIWGSGDAPAHANKFDGGTRGKLELYTSHRFIALSGVDAHGYAGNDYTAQVATYAQHYFPPRKEDEITLTDGPCPEWGGAQDDSELLAMALRAEPVQAVAPDAPAEYRPDATFGDLWTRNVEVLRRRYPPNRHGQEFDASDADLALAHKLAYWTGRDVARTERLMHMSGLVRDKWQRRRGWITETITRAARKTRVVYGEDNAAARMSAEQREFYAQRVHELVGCFLREKKQKQIARFPIMRRAELLAQPELTWIVQDVLPAEGVAAIYGPSGSGKTFLALDLAAHVSHMASETWFGHKIRRKVPVTYLALEGSRGVAKRVRAWEQTYRAQVSDAMVYIDAPFSLMQNSDDVQALARALQDARQHNGVVIVDTLARAAPGADENSFQDMGTIVANATKLQKLVGGLVLLVHHTGKTKENGMRGHSSLHAALDCAIEVDRVIDETGVSTRTWKLAKAKDGEDGRTTPFRLNVVRVGVDQDDEPITSCAVIGEDGAQAVQTAPEKKAKQKQKEQPNPFDKLHDQAKAAYRTLDELLAKDADNTVHDTYPCVHWTHAENALRNAFDGMGVETKNRSSRIERALSQLKGRGFVGLHTTAQNERFYFLYSRTHAAQNVELSNQNLQPTSQPQPKQPPMQATVSLQPYPSLGGG